MLENIKLILEIKDNTYDELINLYITKVEFMVLEYCNIKELTEGLRSFIEDKVVSIIKPKVTGGMENTGEIKSISRGDTRIEYNVGEASDTSSKSATLTSYDKAFLKRYKKARCF